MQRDNRHDGDAHDDIAELLGAYALGAVSAAEAATVERHLAGCAACRDELAELRAAAAALPLLAEEREPPADLRRRIAASAHAESPTRSDATTVRGNVIPFYRRPVVSWLAAAVLLVAVVGMGAWNMRLRQQLNDQVVAMAVQPMSSAPVQATILYMPDRQMAVFAARQLPPLQPGEVYEMWLVQGKTMIPAGVFSSPETQQAMQVDLQQYDIFELTVERGPTGSPQPTGDPFAVAHIT